jgi:hypothetical protein
MAKFLQIVNGIPKLVEFNVDIYDESVTIGGGGLAANTPYTLPLGRTYTSTELEVYLNNIRLEDTADYTFVGALPNRTQVSFTFALVSGDVLRFRIDR